MSAVAFFVIAVTFAACVSFWMTSMLLRPRRPRVSSSSLYAGVDPRLRHVYAAMYAEAETDWNEFGEKIGLALSRPSPASTPTALRVNVAGTLPRYKRKRPASKTEVMNRVAVRRMFDARHGGPSPAAPGVVVMRSAKLPDDFDILEHVGGLPPPPQRPVPGIARSVSRPSETYAEALHRASDGSMSFAEAAARLRVAFGVDITQLPAPDLPDPGEDVRE